MEANRLRQACNPRVQRMIRANLKTLEVQLAKRDREIREINATVRGSPSGGLPVRRTQGIPLTVRRLSATAGPRSPRSGVMDRECAIPRPADRLSRFFPRPDRELSSPTMRSYGPSVSKCGRGGKSRTVSLINILERLLLWRRVPSMFVRRVYAAGVGFRQQFDE
jgi:hypothetical protein